jgi:Alpha/beta hydrolase family
MATITTKDGTTIFYKDWGPKDAQPIVFHHGWPLSSDDWDAQMLFFLGNGYRVVAHDRRGHGRSSQVATGHDMDHYASDASSVVEHLDLRNAIHIGHSTGGGDRMLAPAAARRWSASSSRSGKLAQGAHHSACRLGLLPAKSSWAGANKTESTMCLAWHATSGCSARFVVACARLNNNTSARGKRLGCLSSSAIARARAGAALGE